MQEANHDTHQILLQYWGYKAFRPLQEDIIESVLAGKDTLALLPTGGGKSICFQVPAMALEGVCIVVSPLIALMKDQVANLNQRGIKAVAIYSGMRPAEIDIALDNCAYGDIKFLYLSPERLTTDIVRHRIPKMKVSLLAIDEAHCISQWGYDFRPPYLRIAEIRELLPQIPVLALTATATSDVITDICEKLSFPEPHNVFRKSFERKNLTYAVIQEEDKLSRLVKICSKVKGTGIVYVRNRKKTVEIAQHLYKNKIAADYYHAGLDAITRDKKQESWMHEKVRVIVSTNAFGMGIDKPNVRFVVHMDLPDTPEAYFQEAGRGGRDEKKAYAVLLYNKSDIIDIDRFIETSFPELSYIKRVYNALGNYFQLAVGSGKDKSYNFLIADFCKNYDLDVLLTFNALKILEKEGYLFMSEAMSNPSKLFVLLNNEDLYRFQVASPAYDPFIKLILRSYTGLFTQYSRIVEADLAKRSGMDISKVYQFLKKLHQLRVIDYIPQNKKPQISFLTERLNENYISISPENYHQRKKFAVQRADAMKKYVESQNRCRSLLLLEYFGETEAQRCGLCDVCLERNKAELSKLEFDTVLGIIKPLLQKEEHTLEGLMENIQTNIPEARVIKAIQWLVDNDKIEYQTDTTVFRWKK